MPLTLTFKDPETIRLMLRYAQYISLRDGVTGTVEQVAEGVILGFLDEHPNFNEWHRVVNTALVPLEDNIVDFAHAQKLEKVLKVMQGSSAAAR